MRRTKSLIIRVVMLLVAFLIISPYTMAYEYSQGYNRFRPLDQDDNYRKAEPPTYRSTIRPSDKRYHNDNAYQPPVTRPMTQPYSQYRFRDLSEDKSETRSSQPQFREDPRFSSDRSGRRSKRWTGNDVIAPSQPYVPETVSPPTNGWPNSSVYAPAPMPYPQPYAPERRNSFPWPGDFMPSFSW